MANANGTADDDEAAATRLCYDSHWLARAMGANYPRITYYLCNTGRAAEAQAAQRLRGPTHGLGRTRGGRLCRWGGAEEEEVWGLSVERARAG